MVWQICLPTSSSEILKARLNENLLVNSFIAKSSDQPTEDEHSVGKLGLVKIKVKASVHGFLKWKNPSGRKDGCLPLKIFWEELESSGIKHYSIEKIEFWLEKPIRVNGGYTPTITFRLFNPAIRKLRRDLIVNGRMPNQKVYDRILALRNAFLKINPNLSHKIKATGLLSKEGFDDRYETGTVTSQLGIGYDFAVIVDERIVEWLVRDHDIL